MNNTILLNNEEYKVNESDLPYLVIYREKSGGSHFTITLVKDLFLSGSKILFFTAFYMAKDNFLEQIGPDHSNISFIETVADLEINKDKQVLILNSGDENLLKDVLKTIKDLDERVVLLKNIEAFNANTLEICLDLEKVILSGDLDTCVLKDKIIEKKFNSIVVFTKPEIPLPFDVPILEKWQGYLSSKDKNGIIKIQK